MYERIAGYAPGSDVSQHNLIDLDQAEMEMHLKVNDFAKAKAIYTLGGNSGAKASITVGALAAQAAKGAAVMQGGVAKGKMKSAAGAGSTSTPSGKKCAAFKIQIKMKNENQINTEVAAARAAASAAAPVFIPLFLQWLKHVQQQKQQKQ